jgi:hypothetical protein
MIYLVVIGILLFSSNLSASEINSWKLDILNHVDDIAGLRELGVRAQGSSDDIVNEEFKKVMDYKNSDRDRIVKKIKCLFSKNSYGWDVVASWNSSGKNLTPQLTTVGRIHNGAYSILTTHGHDSYMITGKDILKKSYEDSINGNQIPIQPFYFLNGPSDLNDQFFLNLNQVVDTSVWKSFFEKATFNIVEKDGHKTLIAISADSEGSLEVGFSRNTKCLPVYYIRKSFTGAVTRKLTVTNHQLIKVPSLTTSIVFPKKQEYERYLWTKDMKNKSLLSNRSVQVIAEIVFEENNLSDEELEIDPSLANHIWDRDTKTHIRAPR